MAENDKNFDEMYNGAKKLDAKYDETKKLVVMHKEVTVLKNVLNENRELSDCEEFGNLTRFASNGGQRYVEGAGRTLIRMSRGKNYSPSPREVREFADVRLRALEGALELLTDHEFNFKYRTDTVRHQPEFEDRAMEYLGNKQIALEMLRVLSKRLGDKIRRNKKDIAGKSNN